MNASKSLATGAAILTASLAGAGIVLALDNPSPSAVLTPAPAAAPAADGTRRVADVPATAKQIYDGAKDAVAYIRAATPQGTGTGTGFAVTQDGLIVTNAHVVDGASEIQVQLGTGGSPQPAQLVGVAASKDLAVLRIDTGGRRIATLKLADSSQVGVGDATYAIGNPYGLDHTFTTGIVSALDREIQAPDGSTIDGVIQTDAAINPGNSGGPLLNGSGEVIGVNSQIVSGSQTGGGGNVGIGFAIPASTVAQVVAQAAQGDLREAAPQAEQQAGPQLTPQEQQQLQQQEQQQAQPDAQQQAPSLAEQLLQALQG